MRAPPCPGDTHVLFEQFWLERGPLPLPALGRDDDGASRRFVLTASVKGQLANLARCVLARRHPILLQVCGCVVGSGRVCVGARRGVGVCVRGWDCGECVEKGVYP